MKILTIIARLLLGLIFIVFGLNGFLHFLKMPPPPPGPAGQFVGALFMSGFFYVIAAVQVVGGVLLIAGRFVALGLLLLGPVVVNIFLFHAFMEPSGLPLAIVVAVLAAFLLWSERAKFAPIFKP